MKKLQCLVRLMLLTMVALGALPAVPAQAQLSDILLAPKTLIDRMIEARSAQDIVTDNRIVVDVNAIMVEIQSIKASTKIYEQRLLVTGIFDDRTPYDIFETKVRQVDGVKELLWHVALISEAEQQRDPNILDWDDVLVINTRIGVNLIATRGVADVNFRTVVDSFGTAYLLGRARSQEELNKAMAVLSGTEGVVNTVNYAVVRP